MARMVLAPNERSTSVDTVRTGGGRPLPPPLQHRLETAFGQDFAGVRIHEGHDATLAGALSFAKGDNIYFAPGQYRPHDSAGQELIGHELAHVVQQRGVSATIDVPRGMVVVEDRSPAKASTE
jgi:hypothetical protein